VKAEARMPAPEENSCKTVEDAVNLVISSMSTEELEEVRSIAEEDLIFLHFGLGERVRNLCGLWSGNKDLLRACGSEEMHPDDASSVIFNEIWRRLQTRH